jgi:hypothetical protein
MFKRITKEKLRENLSDFLMHHYYKDFKELKKFIFLDIDKNLFEKLRIRPVTKNEIEELINRFEEDKCSNNSKIAKIKQAWKENEKEILDNIKRLTNIKISTKEIVCYFDPYTNLGFYGKGNISISVKGEINSILMIITHELFHIFYWKKLKGMGLTQNDPENAEAWEWELSEVTVYLLLKDKSLLKFWPNVKMELYPEVEKTYEKVREIWRKNDFENYLIKSYQVLKKK